MARAGRSVEAHRCVLIWRYGGPNQMRGGALVMAGRGNILVVDDESDVRLLLFLVISKADHGLRVVGEAASGPEALAMRRELEVDVVVLDHRMPGMTGMEAAVAMLAEAPDLPIILYSAFIDAAMAEEARTIGVRACVAKGDVKALVAKLGELTGLEVDESEF